MITHGVLALDPSTERRLAEIAAHLKPHTGAIVRAWREAYEAFAAERLPEGLGSTLRCGPEEFDLIVGSLTELPLERYYLQMAEAGRRFAGSPVSYEALTAWIHLLEDSYLPFINQICTEHELFKDVLMSFDALLHNDFAIIASAYFEAREQVILERSRQLAALSEDNRRLYEAERAVRREVELSRERQNRLLAQLITAQEDERRRISLEIHDGPTQGFSAVLMSLQTCRELAATDPQRAVRLLEGLEGTVREIIVEMRRLINDLRPSGLDDMGLLAAVKQQLRLFSRDTGIRATLAVQGEPAEPDPQTSAILFRILQEGLANARKHSGAETVEVGLDFAPDGRELTLAVSDDGQGFEVRPLEQGADLLRFGLMGMRERAELLGGEFSLASAPGQGTRVTVRVPLGPAPVPSPSTPAGRGEEP